LIANSLNRGLIILLCIILRLRVKLNGRSKMGKYIDTERYHLIAEEVIKVSNGQIVELMIVHTIQDNARFMESTITQYGRINDLRLTVRVRFGNKSGVATTNSITKDGILDVVKMAEQNALNAKEDPFLPDPEEKKELEHEQIDPAVAEMGPDEKSRFLGKIFSEFSEDFIFHGTLRSSLNYVGIFNNLGLKSDFFLYCFKYDNDYRGCGGKRHLLAPAYKS